MSAPGPEAPRGFFARPYLLLTITTFIWGANAVAARLVVPEASPMAVNALRWAIALGLLLPFLRREIPAHAKTLRANWRYALALGTIGFTCFSALLYAAAHRTTAINIAIIQGAFPAIAIVGARLVLGTKVRGAQALGVLVTLAGIVLLAAHGDPTRLASLEFNDGDLWMMLAVLFYAAYAIALRFKPALPALVFYAALACGAFLSALPLLAAEIALGAFRWPTPKGWAIIAFVGLAPSLAAQIFFIRGVELIGPARAGIFYNLTPVFGAILAVIVLHEPFRLDHLIALGLVLGGIWIAERGARARA